jgi:CheY-like chemotaxis protein
VVSAATVVPAKAKTPEETVVMIADDSKVVRVKTGRLLGTQRYQVVMAEDGLDAARQIESRIARCTDYRRGYARHERPAADTTAACQCHHRSACRSSWSLRTVSSCVLKPTPLA